MMQPASFPREKLPAYKAGMVVNENPIRLVYKIPRSNYRAYAEGTGIYNLYSAAKEIASDATYSYVEMTLPFGAFNGIWLVWPTLDSGQDTSPTTMTPHPNANKTPAFTGTGRIFRIAMAPG
ncbi:hypothetical protein [Klebsiella michiganensis]|uniref:hypothetical protein n=1 Tax=Klebsiella michiganensis TaxID=1134687 RepID=UPI00189179E8|nr:hypothetical protein [Klebsiella michiganensis]